MRNPNMHKTCKYYRDLINHLIRKSKKVTTPHVLKNVKETAKSFGLELMN